MAIILKEDIRFRDMPDMDGLEILWVRISIYSTSLIVGAFYRPPGNDNSFEDVNQYFLTNVHSSSSIILAGDFNLPNIQWESTQSSCSISQALIELTLVHDLVHIVNAHRRVSDRRDSIIDLVFLSQNLVERVKDVDIFGGIS